MNEKLLLLFVYAATALLLKLVYSVAARCPSPERLIGD